MFKDKPKEPPVQQEGEDKSAAKQTGPQMSGNFMGYRPQWKHRSVIFEIINKRILKLDSDQGKEWTYVHYITIRGGVAIQMPDGTQVQLGIPFPQDQPGILETIGLCGHEQAMALAWSFAATCASHGAEIDVRTEEYELAYSIKTKLYEGKKAA